MAFEVIPALDLAAGRLAVVTADGPAPATAYDGDPVAAASAAIAAGARWLHVVDTDLAFGGRPDNLGVIGSIAEMDVRVQASGGIRTGEQVRAMLDAGARRVVLGSGALTDEADALRTIETLSGSIVVGIEVDEGRIRSRGAVPVDLPLAETLGWLVAGGAPRFLVTAVDRVGRLGGPDVGVVKRVVRSGRPVIAAGGVAGLDDLRAIRRAGAVGAVVGRAALEGGLDLARSMAALR
jgi:phosphoribosylformimino-5-aminoimidazole carboxamide ribonucleotide (ProFAR) isomerase